MQLELPELGYELDGDTDNGFVFGMDTPYIITNIDYGTADFANNDIPAPRSDGLLFGRVFVGGPQFLLDVAIIPNYPIPGNGVEATDLWGVRPRASVARSAREGPPPLVDCRRAVPGDARPLLPPGRVDPHRLARP